MRNVPQAIAGLLKLYWLELLVFGGIAAVLLICQSPDATWMNTDSDGMHYVYSAKYLYPAHKGSAPLYLLLSNLFLRLPFGTEFWRMALISVLSGIAGSVLIYLIIKQKLPGKPKYYGLIGALVYGGSALAISQNTIVESYPLVTAVCLAIYLMCLKQKWLTASILIGVAGAIHPTSILITIPLLIAYKPLRNWKRLAVAASFIVFYLYIPLTNRPPYMWNMPNSEGGALGFIGDTVSTALMLTGGIAIPDLPKRILDAGGLILLNFAIIGVYPLIKAFDKKWYKDILFWVMAIPTIYYITDLSPQVYVYVQPTIAFGVIAIGVGLTKVNRKILYSTGIAAILLLSINANYFDIGRTLDPELSATKYYNEELTKVPDGDILMPEYGWQWAAIYLYNKNENRNIIPVCIDTLVSPDYQKMLNEWDVRYEDDNNEDRLSRQNYIALSIVRLNGDVWTTRTTDDRTYGCEVINLANIQSPEKEGYVAKYSTEPPGQLHWKPSNPYDTITGAVEVSEWKFITLSSHNAFYLLSLIIYGFGLGMIIVKFVNYRKRKRGSKVITQ
jgi:hypothetical protein